MHEDDDTLAESHSASPDSERKRISEIELGKRYDLGPVLGRGGMGEVRLARDLRIDREVAVKLLREERRDKDTVARFFREARVQGALEHPAVVPVHDLGIDREGHPYFVMKKLAGTTLHDVLAARATGTTGERWTRRLLLTRLVDVCLAIEFAHQRGVVHRDLKPANIMLGDFGEAYVLDWGLARIVDDAAPISSVEGISGEDGHTAAGDLLGTPGYMSPEQVRGELVDTRTDVFGLGMVLYEILAGTPPLPRGVAAIAKTLEAPFHRPSDRAEVPPELDELCVRATAAAAADRPTARELGDAIQAYLDGDRDLARRRELAAEHALRARAAFIELDEASRAIATREAGRALVLDPENAVAGEILMHLMIPAPNKIPAGAMVAADEERARTRQKVLRWGRAAYVGSVGALGVFLLMPVKHVWPVVLAIALTSVSALMLHLMARRPLPMGSRWLLALLLVNAVVLSMPGILFGPLLIMPIFVLGSLAAYLPQPTNYPPALVIVTHALPLVALVALELTGVLPSTFRIENGGLVLTPWVIDLTPVTAAVILGLTLALQFMNTSLTMITGRREQELQQNRVHAQQWHLKKLVPQLEASPKPEPRA